MSTIPRIRRGRPNASFSKISNALICDQSLSPEARLVLIYLLSKFENWQLQINDIRKLLGQNGKPCGRNKTYQVIKQLKDANYIVDCQDLEGGRFCGVTYFVFDEPHVDPEAVRLAHGREAAEECQSSPSPNNRDTVPTPGKRDPENRDHIKEGKKQNTDSERARAREAEDKKSVDRAFRRLVKDWPGFVGMPKEAARIAWSKLKPAERVEAAAMRDRWLALLRSQKKTHTPSPSTYFNELLWRDVPDKPEREPSTVFEAPPFSKAWIVDRLARLLAGPEVTEYSLTNYESKAICDGQLERAGLMLEKQALWLARNQCYGSSGGKPKAPDLIARASDPLGIVGDGACSYRFESVGCLEDGA